MEMLCSFAGVSPCRGELNKISKLVQLTQCRDDVTNHLSAVHLSKSNLSEVQLILVRAGMFNIREEKIANMKIYPNHRHWLGKGWRPLRSCQYPSHSGKKGALHGRSVVNFITSQDISTLFGVTVQIGSRKH